MKDDRLYLIHIWECIQRIESYAVEGKTAFLASNMMQMRYLTILVSNRKIEESNSHIIHSYPEMVV
jgi:uncharacterized protein with HEPN domain